MSVIDISQEQLTPVTNPADTESGMPPMARAMLLTERIKENGSTAARAVWAIGRDLRTMKAEELFTELGYDTFEDYAEKEFQLHRRQAYTYISVYEKMGQGEFTHSAAHLGITKLSLLTTVNAEDRAEILEEHDVAGMTTKELEKLLADYKQQGEQLSLLQEEVEQLRAAEPVEIVKEVSDTQELNLARQLQKEAETKAEKAEERAEGAEKKLDKKHKDLLTAEKRAKEAQTELQELKEKLESEEKRHREEVEKLRAEAEKPAVSGDKQNFKAAYAASYKEFTGLLELISSTEDKQERQIFTAKTQQLLALVGEKLNALEGAADE